MADNQQEKKQEMADLHMLQGLLVFVVGLEDPTPCERSKSDTFPMSFLHRGEIITYFKPQFFKSCSGFFPKVILTAEVLKRTTTWRRRRSWVLGRMIPGSQTPTPRSRIGRWVEKSRCWIAMKRGNR
jgi:hypothetical protein